MTDNELLSRELLTFLSSIPRNLKTEKHAFAGKLAVQLGNAILSVSYSLERGRPQIWQPVEEDAKTLFALGKQLRDVGLELWEIKVETPWSKTVQADIDGLKTRVSALELRKGGGK